MDRVRTAALGAAAVMAALTAAGQGADARTRFRHAGVGQHATVMNNIYRAQQQNNAVIDQVQNNIRANQQRAY